jgi:hypothetical protein
MEPHSFSDDLDWICAQQLQPYCLATYFHVEVNRS